MSWEAMNSTSSYATGGEDTTFTDYSYSEDPDGTVCSLESVRNFSRSFLPAAYGLICVSGLLGNLLVVATLAFYKKAKSMTDVYLLHMAVADVLFVLTLPFWAAEHALGEWALGDAGCRLVRGLYALNFHCGMLLLACVGLDRYVAVVQATRSFRLRARALAHRRPILAAVWTLALLLSAGAFAFHRSYPLGGRQVCELSLPAGWEPLRWKLLLLGLQLLGGFFLPLGVMGACYLCVVLSLLRSRNAKRRRAVRVVAAVVLVFLGCQVPYAAALLATAARLGAEGRSCPGEQRLALALTLTQALAFLHCCLNPLLYAFVGQRFRGHFLRAAKDLWCLRGASGTGAGAGPPCAWLHSDTAASRQNSEAADDASSFTM
ncbi:C-C chemokine receptor type 6 [Erinaceus europaeus]|uniref:C-C chemokine receptor type 6 n=1 Tax=Erinaceus europaeus TaxID=9365 RepID=A0A1S2ZMI9_ERIEU|nr:C-C chemokine receptor type 6 [Erinaceus europaeus]XP_060039889.1 C-C chemokine receptor type 6 [Erinaceus europaeus]